MDIELWIPPSFEKKIKLLINERKMHIFRGREEDLFVAAAILGYPKLKDMTAEAIIGVLEEATLK